MFLKGGGGGVSISGTMAPRVTDLVFGGKGSQDVELRSRSTNLGPMARSSSRIEYGRTLNFDPDSRGVCVAAGSDGIMDQGRATQIPQVLNGYFASDAVVP